MPLLSELGIGVTAYGVLSRGLLSGSKPKSARDFRAHLPRFSGENLQRNERLVETFRQLATEKGATASQLAIAWVLAKGPSIVPLVGARKRAQIAESLKALQVALSAGFMFRPDFPGGPPDMFICGNHDDAKTEVAAILKDFGWGVVDVGGIECSRYC